MWQKTKTFLQEAKKEFDKITWPSREDTIKYTIFVIILSLSLAAVLGLLDYIFTRLLSLII